MLSHASSALHVDGRCWCMTMRACFCMWAYTLVVFVRVSFVGLCMCACSRVGSSVHARAPSMRAYVLFSMRWSFASNCLPDSERVCVRLCSRAHCVHECSARVTLIVVCAHIDCTRICMRAVRLFCVCVYALHGWVRAWVMTTMGLLFDTVH